MHNDSLSNLLLNFEPGEWSQKNSAYDEVSEKPFSPDWKKSSLSRLSEEVVSDQNSVEASVKSSKNSCTSDAFFRIVNSVNHGKVLLPGVFIHTHFMLILCFI